MFHGPKAAERLKDQTRYRLVVVEQKITNKHCMMSCLHNLKTIGVPVVTLKIPFCFTMDTFHFDVTMKD